MGIAVEKSFVLFCAGEDSGDILGQRLVETCVNFGMKACGSGGARMLSAGLQPIVDFEHLPVSGFGDVLSNYKKLSVDFEQMQQALCRKDCMAFVAIDYPGFNMKLVKLAKKLGKPVLYVAPPQIWAWKSNRAKSLRGIPLAVFYDFELNAYHKYGCCARLMQHPIMEANVVHDSVKTNEVILLPGSRLAQAKRNLETFLNPAMNVAIQGDVECGRVTVFAVRESLVKPFAEIIERLKKDNFHCEIQVEKPSEFAGKRLERYSKASLALVCPGTATLEVALANCPMVICTKPDALTYVLGNLLVRSPVLGLPNLILHEKRFEEYVVSPFASRNSVLAKIAMLSKKAKENPTTGVAGLLRSKMSCGISAQKLMLEFLGEFVKGQSH